jgi:FG-GAP repeat
MKTTYLKKAYFGLLLLSLLLLSLLIVSCQSTSKPSLPLKGYLNDDSFDIAIDETNEAGEHPIEYSSARREEIGSGVEQPNLEKLESSLSAAAVTNRYLNRAFGHLVYIKHDASSTNPWSIYVQDQATSLETLVYAGNREVQSVAIDHRSSFVYFSARETEDPGSDFEIWKVRLGTLRIYRLTKNDFDDLDISASLDGSKIAWQSKHPRLNIQLLRWRKYDISVNPPLNLGQFKLVTTTSLYEPTLTGDGNHLVYVRPTGSQWKIELYNFETNSVKEIYTSRYPVKSPSASNQGLKVGWIETLADRERFRLMDYSSYAAGSLNTMVVKLDGLEHSHITANGKFLTYGAMRNGVMQIVTLRFRFDPNTNPPIAESIFKTLDTGNKRGMFWEQQLTTGVTEDALLIPSGTTATDKAGQALASEGNFTIIGSPSASHFGTIESPGYATIYERLSNGSWDEVQRITATDGEAEDYFGGSVDISGDYTIIGATASANYPPKTGIGYAYIFKRQSDGQWQQHQKLFPSDGARYDSFGSSVAIDGDIALVGSSYKGAVYVFQRQADDTWLEVQKLVGSGKEYLDQFGCSLALEGSRVVIGNCVYAQYFNTPPSAYIFERQSSGQWTEIQRLVGQGSTRYDQFGHAVALSGDHIVVGAYEDSTRGLGTGAAYIFERQTNGTWLEKQKLYASDSSIYSSFGHSTSIQEDRILIGAVNAIGNHRAGAAYIFQRQSDSKWIETRKLISDQGFGGYENASLGWAVTLNQNNAIVSAPILQIFSTWPTYTLGGVMVYNLNY